jgi:hypothetical protein
MASDPIPCDALPAHSELAHLHSHFDSALAAGPVVLKAPDECRWRGAKPVSGMRRGHALSTAGRRECECERQQLRTGLTHRSAHGPARVECDDDTIKHDNTTQPCHGPRDTGGEGTDRVNVFFVFKRRSGALSVRRMCPRPCVAVAATVTACGRGQRLGGPTRFEITICRFSEVIIHR